MHQPLSPGEVSQPSTWCTQVAPQFQLVLWVTAALLMAAVDGPYMLMRVGAPTHFTRSFPVSRLETVVQAGNSVSLSTTSAVNVC
jgi:hypothetical protein